MLSSYVICFLFLFYLEIDDCCSEANAGKYVDERSINFILAPCIIRNDNMSMQYTAKLLLLALACLRNALMLPEDLSFLFDFFFYSCFENGYSLQKHAHATYSDFSRL